MDKSFLSFWGVPKTTKLPVSTKALLQPVLSWHVNDHAVACTGRATLGTNKNWGLYHLYLLTMACLRWKMMENCCITHLATWKIRYIIIFLREAMFSHKPIIGYWPKKISYSIKHAETNHHILLFNWKGHSDIFCQQTGTVQRTVWWGFDI
jgi:hypothetical protein